MTIIAIESADSIGKDTLIDLIKEKHPNFVFERFPDEKSSSGRLTRDILNRNPDLPPIVLQHIFISNFFESYNWLSHFKREDFIFPPGTLILNRYFMSTLAYSMAQGMNIEHFKTITALLPQPDLWILLEGERRGLSAEDRHDTDHKLQLKVIGNYRALFLMHPEYNSVTIVNDSTPEAMLEKFEKAMETLK